MSMDTPRLTISILPGSYAICRSSPGKALPGTPPAECFWSLSVTEDEISLVLPREHVLPGWTVDGDWRCLKVEGPLELDQTGVLASIAAPLSAGGIPVFAVSTYDTDYFLVRAARLEEAVEALTGAGHRLGPRSAVTQQKQKQRRTPCRS